MVIRKFKWKVFCIGLTACFSFLITVCFSQPVQTITDKKDILIGEQIKLKIKATILPGFNGQVKWISVPDSIPHFEIVEAGKTDTVSFPDNSKAIEQTLILTSFDSGKWIFPSLPLEYSSAQGQPLKQFNTDSFVVNVSYSPPDSTNELRDIKPIIKVTFTDYTWYYIIGGIVLGLLIIALVYWYWKKRKKPAPALVLSKLSPYDEAIQELNKLTQYDLQVTEDIKQYHSRLSGIFKRYLGRKQNKNLLTKTTGDLLIRMAESGMTADHVSDLATALRCTDAVKFAKYLPAVSESEGCLQKIKTTIKLKEQQTPNHKS